jgi:hypothetical protein
MHIEKYSIGIGDRFGRQGAAQLAAVQRAAEAGALVVPVWNKSFREHSIIGTRPADVRAEADEAVRAAGWRHGYHVDADHVGVATVDGFLGACDFFTLDVADFIGRPAPPEEAAAFAREMAPFRGALRIPGLQDALRIDDQVLEAFGRQYLTAVGEAARTYRHVAAAKGAGSFITEVSVDEAAEPQPPLQLFLILGALARARVPVETIAPKFSGKFLKGVDYVGDRHAFARELDADLAVVAHARDVFGLPASLKISVHTGSDKLSLYPIIRRALRAHDAGLHLKTAGTTWLEEVIGVAQSGARGLAVARRIYAQAHARLDELRRPYATVVEIDAAALPSPAAVSRWTADEFVARLRHDPKSSAYDPNLRQLLHVAFRVAAEMGAEWHGAFDAAREITARGVTDNLYDRHLRPIFVDR